MEWVDIFEYNDGGCHEAHQAKKKRSEKMVTKKYRNLGIIFLGLIILGWLCGAPAPVPILRIETGMHTAIIQSVAVDAQGHFLVTASRDKAVRLWDVQTGELLATFRPPIGVEKEGMMFAVAITPDGQMVAAGGVTAPWGKHHSIYVFDRTTREVRHRLGGLPGVVYSLKFSRDDQRLAAAFSDGSVRIFGRDGDELAVIVNPGSNGGCTGVDFDVRGRLATSCLDGTVRLYNKSFRLLNRHKVLVDKQPYTVRFSPDGAQVAVGLMDAARVEVLSGQNLELQFQPDVRGMTGAEDLVAVAWSRDGMRLCASGKWVAAGQSRIRCWAGVGQGAYQDLVASSDAVYDLASLPSGQMVFGAGDPAWGVLTKDGQLAHFHARTTADFRNNPAGLLTNEDGGRVQFGYAAGGALPARFAVEERTLTLDPAADAALLPPRTTIPGLAISGHEVNLNGRKFLIRNHENVQAVAIDAQAEKFALGTERYLRVFDRDGKRLWVVAAPGETQAINMSGNGRLVVAAYGDGTIRWYRASDGAELLAFFPHADRQRWVAWTPEGFYATSPGGETLVGWHLNRGPDQAARFFPASRYSERFRKPEKIARALK